MGSEHPLGRLKEGDTSTAPNFGRRARRVDDELTHIRVNPCSASMQAGHDDLFLLRGFEQVLAQAET